MLTSPILSLALAEEADIRVIEYEQPPLGRPNASHSHPRSTRRTGRPGPCLGARRPLWVPRTPVPSPAVAGPVRFGKPSKNPPKSRPLRAGLAFADGISNDREPSNQLGASEPAIRTELIEIRFRGEKRPQRLPPTQIYLKEIYIYINRRASKLWLISVLWSVGGGASLHPEQPQALMTALIIDDCIDGGADCGSAARYSAKWRTACRSVRRSPILRGCIFQEWLETYLHP
jgi:hypothetical protein